LSGIVGLLNKFYHTDDDGNTGWMQGIEAGDFATPAKCKSNGGYQWYCQIADGGNMVQSGCGCTAAQIAAGSSSQNEGCGGKDVFSRRTRNLLSDQKRKLTVPKTCAKDLVEGGAPFNLPIPQTGTKGSLGDGISATWSWNYTCPEGQTPFHNATIDGVLAGDYSEIMEDWQVECTSYQIAFQCCTSACACHDPVAGLGSGASTAIAQDTATGTASSSTTIAAASAAVVAVAAVGAVAVLASRRKAHDEQENELHAALTTDGYTSL
jgi:hypothetical protein